jgi:hypothetical protein
MSRWPSSSEVSSASNSATSSSSQSSPGLGTPRIVLLRDFGDAPDGTLEPRVQLERAAPVDACSQAQGVGTGELPLGPPRASFPWPPALLRRYLSRDVSTQQVQDTSRGSD